ncbi:MAG TPA: translocation/assembly module TamB domain-containing protein, partial [Bdellovibrionota bacterium]|nr:translocation/assembly module TamB domain-containing protein [Bdellovibrionota bacterium]
ELLSLLALGLTSSDSKRLSSSDRSLVEQGEAGSLLLHSLGFNKEVKDRTGLEVQLDEATNSQIGTSIFRPQDQSQSTTAPRIVIRRKIGSRMELSAKSTVGVGAGNQREVNAELSVTPGLSVIGVWDYRETVDAQKNTSTINGSYGLDLKIQKRFK